MRAGKRLVTLGFPGLAPRITRLLDLQLYQARRCLAWTGSCFFLPVST